MLSKLLCFIEIHQFKLTHVDLTFSLTDKIETFQCIRCNKLKIVRRKFK